jgi:hypothetical protein
VLLAVTARFAIFVVAAQAPVLNQRGAVVSPLEMQTGNDIRFYLRSMRIYQELSLPEIVEVFTKYFDFDAELPEGAPVDCDPIEDVCAPRTRSVIGMHADYFLAPPVFPMLLSAFNYQEGNTLPFGVFYLFLSSLLVFLWLRWLWAKGIAAHWLFVFALIPNPIWFTLSISTELTFALVFAVFYLAYTARGFNQWRVALWILFLGLTLLTRPNGVSFLLFVIADSLLFTSRSLRVNLLLVTLVITPILAGTVFFFGPHLNIFVFHSATISYFGTQQGHYLTGIYGALPVWLDLPLSLFSLVGAKVLYFVGLRPTYGELPLVIQFARGAVGVILLPGLIYLFLKADWRLRLLVGLYLLPIFLGATQDRYNLAIQPILFFYGVLSLSAIWSRVRGRSNSVPDTVKVRD